MEKSRKSRKTSDGNKHKTGKGTRKNTVYPRNLGTSDDRIKPHIPKNSQIYRFLFGDNEIINMPIWRRLDLILTQAQTNSDDMVSLIFDEFVARIGIFYPDKKDKIEKLRALILWHIIGDEELTEAYWKKLREI